MSTAIAESSFIISISTLGYELNVNLAKMELDHESYININSKSNRNKCEKVKIEMLNVI